MFVAWRLFAVDGVSMGLSGFNEIRISRNASWLCHSVVSLYSYTS